MNQNVFIYSQWQAFAHNALFLFILTAISLSLSTQVSAQLLSPGTNKSESQIEQVPDPETLINVFLDCRGCREVLLKEIGFVNFVRDMADAEVHLIITNRRTAPVSQYQLSFLGYKAMQT